MMENLFVKHGQRPNIKRRSGTLRRTGDISVWKEKAKKLIYAVDDQDLLSYPIEAFKELDVFQRIRLLKRLSAGSLTEAWFGSVNKEEIVVKLVQTTPKEDIITFFNELPKEQLFAKLNEKMSNAGGKDYYTEYYFELLTLYRTSVLPELIKSGDYNKEYLIWNSNLIGGSLIPYVTSYKTSNNTISILNRETQKSKEYDPFKTLILIECESKLLANQINDQIVVPAFFFHWIASEHLHKTAFAGVDFGIDVASLFVGLGEIKIAYKAQKYVRVVLGRLGVLKSGLDVGITITGAFITENDRKIISKFVGGSDFIDDWGNISPYIELNLFGAGITTSSMVEGFDSFTASWNVIKLNADLRKELGEDKWKQINDFSEYLLALVKEVEK